MQSLPEFFCDKFPQKTPEVYMSSRNFIIKLYRERPTAYLSATGKTFFLILLECRKKLPGDICSIIRLHAFLEHWGLINFNVESALKPPKIQLGGSGKISKELIDIAAKGYISLKDAETLALDNENNSNCCDNLYLIAAQKSNALAANKRPICNLCGEICTFLWYRRKIANQKLDQDSSLVNVLRSLSSNLIVC